MGETVSSESKTENVCTWEEEPLPAPPPLTRALLPLEENVDPVERMLRGKHVCREAPLHQGETIVPVYPVCSLVFQIIGLGLGKSKRIAEENCA